MFPSEISLTDTTIGPNETLIFEVELLDVIPA